MNSKYIDKIKKIESLFLYNEDLKCYLEDTLFNLKMCYDDYKEDKDSMIKMYFYKGNEDYGDNLVIIGYYNKINLLFEHLYRFYKKIIDDYNDKQKCYNCPIKLTTKIKYNKNKDEYDKYCCDKKDLFFYGNQIRCMNAFACYAMSYQFPIVCFSEIKLNKYGVENV